MSYLHFTCTHLLLAVCCFWMMLDGQDVEQEYKQTRNRRRAAVFLVLLQNCTNITYVEYMIYKRETKVMYEIS